MTDDRFYKRAGPFALGDIAGQVGGRLASPGDAAIVIHDVADLKAASEVPPNDSKGTGAVTATYDTASKKFTYTITYMNLTGAATAAHFHGPAAVGAQSFCATNFRPMYPHSWDSGSIFSIGSMRKLKT